VAGLELPSVRLQATQALDRRRHAAGDAASLFPGGLTTLEKHEAGSENLKLPIVRFQPVSPGGIYRSWRRQGLGQGESHHQHEGGNGLAFRSASLTGGSPNAFRQAGYSGGSERNSAP